MDELLSQVLEAHGGLDRWNQVTQITAHLSAGGPFWAGRGWPDILADTTVTLDAHREQITFAPFGVPGRQSSFSVDPERIVISNTSGDILDERCDPRGSFPSEFDPRSTPWDAVQVAYFTSYAMWNYLTAPFVFTYPDVEAKEIDPWQEAGETWRRLAVTFPPSIANQIPIRSSTTTRSTCSAAWTTRRKSLVGYRSPTTPMTPRPSTASSSPPDASSTATTNMASPTNHLR